MSEESLNEYEAVYEDVMSLYNFLKGSNLVRVRRAEMRQGECKAEPIDFLADVDIKTARALSTRERPSFNVLYRELLGKTFEEYGLHKEGAYKELYKSTEGQR